MMPISVKLTLMVLVLPVFSISMVFVVGFYFYRESLMRLSEKSINL